MKKLLVLMVLGLAFLACDYATEATELGPDIEVTWINPLGWYLGADSTAGPIEVDFVARNSIDAYLQNLVLEYYDTGNQLFLQTEPMPLYAKVHGIVEQGAVDTTKILNIYIPADTVLTYLISTNTHAAKALLKFIFTDELFNASDTATVWFGFYLFD